MHPCIQCPSGLLNVSPMSSYGCESRYSAPAPSYQSVDHRNVTPVTVDPRLLAAMHTVVRSPVTVWALTDDAGISPKPALSFDDMCRRIVLRIGVDTEGTASGGYTLGASQTARDAALQRAAQSHAASTAATPSDEMQAGALRMYHAGVCDMLVEFAASIVAWTPVPAAHVLARVLGTAEDQLADVRTEYTAAHATELFRGLMACVAAVAPSVFRTVMRTIIADAPIAAHLALVHPPAPVLRDTEAAATAMDADATLEMATVAAFRTLMLWHELDICGVYQTFAASCVQDNVPPGARLLATGLLRVIEQTPGAPFEMRTLVTTTAEIDAFCTKHARAVPSAGDADTWDDDGAATADALPPPPETKRARAPVEPTAHTPPSTRRRGLLW